MFSARKFIKTLLGVIIKIWLLPISFLAKLNIDFVMKSIVKDFSTDDCYISYRIRPQKSAKKIQLLPKACYSAKKIAVILQGPIGNNSEFLLETVKFYKKQYHDIDIIVSTWEDEEPETIEELSKEKIYVIQSPKPDYSGLLNVNFQVISTRAGIKKARELQSEYIIKSRTDQRVCKPYIFYSLCGLLDEYEPKNTKLMQRRIIALSTPWHNMFMPYFVSDFFYMGTLDDIEKLFSCDMDYRQDNYAKPMSRKKYSEMMYPPEVYLLKNYLCNYLNCTCNDTVKDYWQCLKDYLICLDRKDIDLFTPKYEYNYMEHIVNSEYDVNDNDYKKTLMGFNFWTWLNLYTGTLQYKTEYEQEMDVEF